jgi:enamine deaminase RidA (YjgF/YER057c/UK114 family)
MKTVFSSPDAPPALGPYSQAIGAGPLIFCSGHAPPARSTIEVSGLPRGAKVEVEAIAIKPS